MKNYPLNLVLFIFLSVLLLSCNKQMENSVSITGKIIDAQTLLPIPNYPLKLSLIDGNSGIGGLNLGSYFNIANCTTNANGEFNLRTNSFYAQDSTDYYEVVSGNNDNYFGFQEEINAKHAELIKNNSLGTIKNYKRIIVNFYVHHLGPVNSNDYIFIDITGVYTFGNNFHYGSDSLIDDIPEVVPNSPTAITWKGIKNNIAFGPFSDTVTFTSANNTYNLSY